MDDRIIKSLTAIITVAGLGIAYYGYHKTGTTINSDAAILFGYSAAAFGFYKTVTWGEHD